MKQALKLIGATTFAWLILFLAGAFYNASFNLKTWDKDSRGYISTFGCIITIFGVGVYAVEEVSNINK